MSETEKDSFASMFEAEAAPKKNTRARNPRLGERVDAIVVKVGKDSVFVELPGKQQAFFEAVELRGPDGEIGLKEGDKVTANIVEIDEERGVIRLGKSMGRPGSAGAVEMAKQSGTPVEGKVISVNKGGFDVDLGGVRAFCPISQIDTRRTEDPAPFLGQSFEFLVTDFKEGGRNVVVSRRALLEREASDNAVAVTVGAVMKGTITAVRDFGAFVDLGGVEGLIPRSEISHDRSVAASDALKPGDQVEVQVREIKDDPTKKPARKITLSLKALTADPWAGLDIAEGRVILGTVVRTAEFGAFVRIAPGVDGLLHVSEQKAAEGEEVLVAIKKIDRESKKISLVPRAGRRRGRQHDQEHVPRGRLGRRRQSGAHRDLRSLRAGQRHEGSRGAWLGAEHRNRRSARDRPPQAVPRGNRRHREGARDGRRQASPLDQRRERGRGTRGLRAGSLEGRGQGLSRDVRRPVEGKEALIRPSSRRCRRSSGR